MSQALDKLNDEYDRLWEELDKLVAAGQDGGRRAYEIRDRLRQITAHIARLEAQ